MCLSNTRGSNLFIYSVFDPAQIKECFFMKKRIFALVMAVAMLCAMAACGGTKNYAENNTEYVIGFSGPLTGAAAVYGVAVQNSAQMAVTRSTPPAV